MQFPSFVEVVQIFILILANMAGPGELGMRPLSTILHF